MPNLNLTNYHQHLDRGDVISSFKTLKSLYGMVDKYLSDIASGFDDSLKSSDLETQLLDDKETLIEFASNTKCKNVHEISHKVDFLNTVYLNEKNADAFSDTDILTKSIWQDCKFFL